MKKVRSAVIKRKTKETSIAVTLAVDGSGRSSVDTGIGFLDHMLILFAFHGLFDLTVKAKGDLKVDVHHTNEDVAICLGKALRAALGDCRGIRRFGAKEVPMDLAAAKVVIDIGGRYSFLLKTPAVWEGELISRDEGYSFDDGRDFLDTFAKSAALNMHIEVYSGKDMHHVLEAVFKALGVALDEATQIDPRRRSVPSTKGVIEF